MGGRTEGVTVRMLGIEEVLLRGKKEWPPVVSMKAWMEGS